ncbi:MAG: lipopolysaccharide assembly protein LapA domain-containing protein [Leptolyngbyaceae cyanobacterium]
MRLYVISALLIAFLAILFALQNTNLVTIELFVWQYQQSLALILLGTLAIGVIVGLLVSVPAVIRRNVRVSRLQKQTESLSQQVEERSQAVQTEAQNTTLVQQNHEELLRLLGVLDPMTGLIRQELMPKAIATQLAHHQKQTDKAQLPPISVLLFKALPVIEDGYPLSEMFAGVATILRQQGETNTWFYSDGQGRFAATNAGLDQKALTKYGEALQAAILESPPVLPSGKTMELDVSVGGAIAESAAAIDSDTLVQTAEQALDQALQRGRNRVRILQAS